MPGCYPPLPLKQDWGCYEFASNQLSKSSGTMTKTIYPKENTAPLLFGCTVSSGQGLPVRHSFLGMARSQPLLECRGITEKNLIKRVRNAAPPKLGELMFWYSVAHQPMPFGDRTLKSISSSSLGDKTAIREFYRLRLVNRKGENMFGCSPKRPFPNRQVIVAAREENPGGPINA